MPKFSLSMGSTHPIQICPGLGIVATSCTALSSEMLRRPIGSVSSPATITSPRLSSRAAPWNVELQSKAVRQSGSQAVHFRLSTFRTYTCSIISNCITSTKISEILIQQKDVMSVLWSLLHPLQAQEGTMKARHCIAALP